MAIGLTTLSSTSVLFGNLVSSLTSLPNLGNPASLHAIDHLLSAHSLVLLKLLRQAYP
jgi:hypothetical protein